MRQSQLLYTNAPQPAPPRTCRGRCCCAVQFFACDDEGGRALAPLELCRHPLGPPSQPLGGPPLFLAPQPPAGAAALLAAVLRDGAVVASRRVALAGPPDERFELGGVRFERVARAPAAGRPTGPARVAISCDERGQARVKLQLAPPPGRLAVRILKEPGNSRRVRITQAAA